jgi:hypothetical protein
VLNEASTKLLFNPFALDPDYEMNMAQWLRIGMFYHWKFYKAGNYLTLTAWRQDTIEAPEERATYLVSMNVRNEDARWRAEFSGEDRDNWRELLPDLLKGAAETRKIREAQARQLGIEIDEDYEDPAIQGLSEQRPSANR